MMRTIRCLNGVMASGLAAELDHYSPGGASIRDFAMPESGFCAVDRFQGQSLSINLAFTF